MTDGNHPYRKGWATLITFLLLTTAARAQFIDLSLNIDPKLTTETRRSLQLKSLPINSGQHNINLGDPAMGIVGITALEYQSLLLGLEIPHHLKHADDTITHTIPIQLSTRCGYSVNDIPNSSTVSNNWNQILIKSNSKPSPWNTIYLFIYGSFTVADIPKGLYQNKMVVKIEYL